MERSRLLRGLAALAAGALALAGAACSSEDNTSSAGGGPTASTAAGDSGGGDAELEPLRVGLLLSLTGDAAVYGVSTDVGARAYFDMINESGGINGRMIEVVSVDDRSDPTQSAIAARQLVTTEGVDVVIGASRGSTTLAVMPIAAEAGVPFIAPNSTISLTDPANDFYPWVFRAAPSELSVSEAILANALSENDRVAIFTEESAYGQDISRHVTEIIERGDYPGVEIVATATSASDATDLTSQAARIRGSEPDVILLLAGVPTVAATFARAIDQLGVDAPIWAAQGVFTQPFITAAGEAAEGVRGLSVANYNDPSPGEAELAALLEAAGENPPSVIEIIGATAAQIIVAAAANLDGVEIDGAAMRDAIENLCPLDTWMVGENECFSPENHDGFGIDAVHTLVVRDGQFATLDL